MKQIRRAMKRPTRTISDNNRLRKLNPINVAAAQRARVRIARQAKSIHDDTD